MYVLGVTGGIGSGKSTVAALLRERGARVLDADRVVRTMYGGGEIAQEIGVRFGADVLQADGAVDRAKLAEIVFADEAKLEELEGLVHPAVRERIRGSIDEWRREGFDGIGVVDAALLVETDHQYPLDALRVVTAPESLRIDRLRTRGVSAEEARRRMEHQAPDDEKRERADFVIENEGTLTALSARVDALLSELGRDDAGSSG
jgi:dephospho-CoA kinase